MNNKLIVSILVLVGGLLIATSTQAQVAISEDGVTFPGDPAPVWGLKQYEIGDIGPAGGWVFHVTDDGLHGLEAAPDDLPSAGWGCYGTGILGAELTKLGTGAYNTQDIISTCSQSAGFVSCAAKDAAGYVSPSGYLDWYLPSIDELTEMYVKLSDNAGPGPTFSLDYYWSSTEHDANYSKTLYWANGTLWNTLKSSAYSVRAIRAF